MHDLQQLPRLADSLSYLYVEHCVVEQKAKAIELFDQDGRTLVPAAALTVLLLGPGTRVTHAAIKALADNGCTVVWVGEDATKYYAHGTGETRRAYHLLHQARLASDERLRLEVCKRMYRHRFGGDDLDPALTLQQLRGMEGARVRTAYAQASLRYAVDWHGRNYKRGSWGATDPINRALSTANALLNGLCHAAIVSGGYSPALGFIHTGKQRSFVYDIADLYKVEITIPVAFAMTGRGTRHLRTRVRRACRDAFKDHKLLQRILPDIKRLLDVPDGVLRAGAEADTDPARPEPLWDPPDAPAAPVKAPIATPLEAPIETRPLPSTEEHALQLRRQRAEAGLDGDWAIHRTELNTWHVLTDSGPPGYMVQRQADGWTCECPDFQRNALGACKHTLAVEMHLAAQAAEPAARGA